MTFEIEPLIGVGQVKLGMSQMEVRSLPFGVVRSFKKTTFSVLPSDYFVDVGIVIYYKEPGTVEAIEFSGPSEPTLNGVKLVSSSVELVKEALLSADPKLEIDQDGFISHSLGIGVALELDEEDNPSLKVQSVIVCEKGYYD
jgi:hypothetical protein